MIKRKLRLLVVLSILAWVQACTGNSSNSKKPTEMQLTAFIGCLQELPSYKQSIEVFSARYSGANIQVSELVDIVTVYFVRHSHYDSLFGENLVASCWIEKESGSPIFVNEPDAKKPFDPGIVINTLQQTTPDTTSVRATLFMYEIENDLSLKYIDKFNIPSREDR